MTDAVYDTSAPKKPQNISINSDLSRQLKETEVNISAECEAHLAQVLRKVKRDQWLEENREALECYDRFIDQYGSFGDTHRRF